MEHVIPVIFADDEPLLRVSWSHLLDQQRDMKLLDAVATADRIPAIAPPDALSIVLLDLSMPGVDSLQTIEALRATHPLCRVLIYSGYSDPDTVHRARAAGAWGVVDKLAPLEEILSVIRQVAAGGTAFPQDRPRTAPSRSTRASEPSIAVLCVDDNTLLIEAVAAMLRSTPGFSFVGHLPSADRLTETARASRPAVVLLDLDMPGKDPFDAIRELSVAAPEVRIIIFSGHVRRDLLDRAIDAGAWGYVSKSDGELALLDGIRGVVGGEFALSPEVRMVSARS